MTVAALYLGLCILLAVTLNASNRWMRGAGTLIAAAALFMISISIILANFDGTFAGAKVLNALDRSKPLVLDVQAAVGLLATLFLLWAAWMQLGRADLEPAPARNSKSRFGLVSRYAHWMTATLMLLLIPMGIFVSVLPLSADRASFLAVHQVLGLAVLIVVFARLSWLLISPAPSLDELSLLQRRLASTAHVSLYILILAFPVTGLLMAVSGGEEVQVFGPALPHLDAGSVSSKVSSVLHDLGLPLAFYFVIFMHVGAVVKHHFGDRRLGDIRRMLQ